MIKEFNQENSLMTEIQNAMELYLRNNEVSNRIEKRYSNENFANCVLNYNSIEKSKTYVALNYLNSIDKRIFNKKRRVHYSDLLEKKIKSKMLSEKTKKLISHFRDRFENGKDIK